VVEACAEAVQLAGGEGLTIIAVLRGIDCRCLARVSWRENNYKEFAVSDIHSQLGIQSWCYRNYKTISEFIPALKSAGVSATEICGVQVDFNKPETFAGAIKQLNDAGVKVLSIGVEHISSDAASARKRFEFLKAAGAKFMSVSFSPDGMWDAFRVAEKLADEYDVKLGIHNHGGYDWLGNDVMLDYIFKNTSPRIGLTLDTAWAMDARQDPIAWVEKYASRLYGVHIKDFTFDRARRSSDVIVGTGNLDLPKFLATLKKVNFKGFSVLEYEADAENPVPALSECVRAVQAAGK
jgi:inosose dehydratase